MGYQIIYRYLFQVVQTQTTTDYCRILPTLDTVLEMSFSDCSHTNTLPTVNVVVQLREVLFYNKLSWFVSELPKKIFFQVVQRQTTTAYCRLLPTLDYYLH